MFHKCDADPNLIVKSITKLATTYTIQLYMHIAYTLNTYYDFKIFPQITTHNA